ncbi:MAG: CYTH domain-containing protein [Pseudomonadales bacterium]|nr:CYTH domain-containing protein [Pseudomonadales bacterium]
MAVEIERKFLVDHEQWAEFKQANGIQGKAFRQGYLSEGQATVRIRIKGEKGIITVKGKTVGLSRLEFEYEIPTDDAEQMLDELCAKPLVDKHRYLVEQDGLTWEVDEFHGENQGLIVAEIELASEDATYTKPAWITEEVSHDQRYFNVNLAKHPFSRW